MSFVQRKIGEIWAESIDFSDRLGSGETLTGTPTVVANPTGELTLGTASISDDTVAFTVTATAAVKDRRYELTATCATSASHTYKERKSIAIV